MGILFNSLDSFMLLGVIFLNLAKIIFEIYIQLFLWKFWRINVFVLNLECLQSFTFSVFKYQKFQRESICSMSQSVWDSTENFWICYLGKSQVISLGLLSCPLWAPHSKRLFQVIAEVCRLLKIISLLQR